ncbi:MAG: class I SAM-dependent methyltransferase [Planctomycetes bacterium]|nr:class I SAM-dependent methyltransferase [Planctomycetota bacterium]
MAADILKYCSPRKGVWVDLGSGSGGVGLALAAVDDPAARASTIVLLDPNGEALTRGLKRAQSEGLAHRVVAVVGRAEGLPLPNDSVDLIFSRGSIFFWDDPVKGFQEINRVLRPGGAAMIGGGLGSTYPEWARREFVRRRRGGRKPDSPQAKEFARLRDPETFRQWATKAGIKGFQVMGDGALPPDDPRAGSGIWLLFTKGGAG